MERDWPSITRTVMVSSMRQRLLRWRNAVALAEWKDDFQLAWDEFVSKSPDKKHWHLLQRGVRELAVNFPWTFDTLQRIYDEKDQTVWQGLWETVLKRCFLPKTTTIRQFVCRVIKYPDSQVPWHIHSEFMATFTGFCITVTKDTSIRINHQMRFAIPLLRAVRIPISIHSFSLQELYQLQRHVPTLVIESLYIANTCFLSKLHTIPSLKTLSVMVGVNNFDHLKYLRHLPLEHLTLQVCDTWSKYSKLCNTYKYIWSELLASSTLQTLVLDIPFISEPLIECLDELSGVSTLDSLQVIDPKMTMSQYNALARYPHLTSWVPFDKTSSSIHKSLFLHIQETSPTHLHFEMKSADFVDTIQSWLKSVVYSHRLALFSLEFSHDIVLDSEALHSMALDTFACIANVIDLRIRINSSNVDIPVLFALLPVWFPRVKQLTLSMHLRSLEHATLVNDLLVKFDCLERFNDSCMIYRADFHNIAPILKTLHPLWNAFDRSDWGIPVSDPMCIEHGLFQRTEFPMSKHRTLREFVFLPLTSYVATTDLIVKDLEEPEYRVLKAQFLQQVPWFRFLRRLTLHVQFDELESLQPFFEHLRLNAHVLEFLDVLVKGKDLYDSHWLLETLLSFQECHVLLELYHCPPAWRKYTCFTTTPAKHNHLSIVVH